jgi:hypothetical protein
MTKNNKKLDSARKLKEYEMKIIKMAGYLSDYYIDRAIELEDFSTISSFMIDYFSGTIGKTVDVGYLISKYKEYGLNDRIEDVDFDIDEWYKIKYEIENEISSDIIISEEEKELTNSMSDDEYILFLVEKRKLEK